MNILLKSRHFVVAVKEPGILSESGEGSMPELLSAALQIESGKIFPVHRLDKMTGGVMVYALDAKTAGLLSKQVAEHQFCKRYYAIAERSPEISSGTWSDLLYWDRQKQKSYVVDRMRKGVKEAVLSYTILAHGTSGNTLFAVELFTGRTHQIRVQFSSRGFPLLGDRRYGSHTGGNLGLWAYSLSFRDPESGKQLVFTCPPPCTDPWNDPAYLPMLNQNGNTSEAFHHFSAE